MTPENYTEREAEVAGWKVRLTSYKLGSEYLCKVDNVSPGAWLARATGATREVAEEKALKRARELLSRTHRQNAA